MNVLRRVSITVNNDPQRRCYNGCHISTETYWSDWKVLESGVSEERIEQRLKFWRELNEYAVSQRGPENTLCEFKAE